MSAWDFVGLATTAGFAAGLYVGGWLEAAAWRLKAKSITRKESGGKLYRVTEEP